MDALLTQAEVAERLRPPVATLRFWRHKGTGPRSANVGGRVLYRQSDVEAWLEKQFSPSETAGDAA
jgi:DNA-binding transcriptional MerR regulator